MTFNRKQRGLAICAAIAVFLFARDIGSRIEEASDSADVAGSVAEEAKSAASEASDAASNAQAASSEEAEQRRSLWIGLKKSPCRSQRDAVGGVVWPLQGWWCPNSPSIRRKEAVDGGPLGRADAASRPLHDALGGNTLALLS